MQFKRKGFGLYVHWPFCQAKCPYCDFNSHVVADVQQNLWRDALVAEIKRYAVELDSPVLDSIFFGGGTPSLMPPDTVATVVETARSCWRSSNNVEITLEANPTSVEAHRFRDFRGAGVNRVSVGVQALNDADLKALGRLHGVAEAKSAFEIARKVFPRVSFDLIYARQNQSLHDWADELSEALAMAADHLSLYQLTIEDGTAFGDRFSRGLLRGLPNEDLAADMFELTQEKTEAAGYLAYETSNHARSGAESKHNLIYWKSGDWVGVGPGAHGRFSQNGKRVATETYLAPAEWLNAVRHSGSGESSRRKLGDREALEESLMMGLRLHNGVSVDVINALKVNDKVDFLQTEGLVAISNNNLRTTKKGRPLLNAILRDLIA